MKQFLTVREASEELGLSKDTVRKMVSEIRDHIPERYSRTDIFEGKCAAVRFAALQDWAETKQKLDAGIAPEPYDPIQRERELGINTSLPAEVRIDIQAIASAVAAELCRRFAGAV